VHLFVSTAARQYVQDRGGLLFIWFTDVGPACWMRHVSTKPPRHRGLVEYQLPVFRVFVDDRFNLPYEMTMDLTPWPLRRISVRTDDDVEGAGEGAGDVGESDGGSGWDWPSGGVGDGGGGVPWDCGGHGGGHGHVSI
jgi:hypothetical protein